MTIGTNDDSAMPAIFGYANHLTSNSSHRGTEAQRIRSMEMNDISGHIVDRALHIHRAMGPGLLESVYH